MAHMPETIILRKTEETKTGVTYGIAKVKTNADRIRAMSDEKLAERFADACCRDYPCEDKYRMPDGMNCYGCWLDWLKKEVEK